MDVKHCVIVPERLIFDLLLFHAFKQLSCFHKPQFRKSVGLIAAFPMLLLYTLKLYIWLTLSVFRSVKSLLLLCVLVMDSLSLFQPTLCLLYCSCFYYSRRILLCWKVFWESDFGTFYKKWLLRLQCITCSLWIIFGRQYLVFDVLLVSSSILWEDIYFSIQRDGETFVPVGQVWWDLGRNFRG